MIMVETDKRHSTTDQPLIATMAGPLAQPDRVYGVPYTYWKSSSSALARNESQLYRAGSDMRMASQLRRPARFPIVAHGFVKFACPWKRYQKTYRLRFGVDFWLTGAQQLAQPCDEVFVRELPDTTSQIELQSFLELRHPNIHAVLGVFQQDRTRHVVFEHMEISLHEIATVGVDTAELATIFKQVCVVAAPAWWSDGSA
jgi:hypothetical protein